MSPAKLWEQLAEVEAFCQDTWSNLRAMELIRATYKAAVSLGIADRQTHIVYAKTMRLARHTGSNARLAESVRELTAALRARQKQEVMR